MLNFHKIYALPLSFVIAAMILAAIFWTVADYFIEIAKNRKIKMAWQILNAAFSMFALIGIFLFTLILRSGENTAVLPFIRTLAIIKAQPELIREMIMNAFLFFPFGLCLPYAMGKGGKRPILPAAITGVAAAILSGGIELSQHIFGIGNAELSDIVMNVTGAAIGVASFIASRIIAKNK